MMLLKMLARCHMPLWLVADLTGGTLAVLFLWLYPRR